MPFAASTAAIASRRQEVGFRGATAHARAKLRAWAVLSRVPPRRVPRPRSAERQLHLPREPALKRGPAVSVPLTLPPCQEKSPRAMIFLLWVEAAHHHPPKRFA